MKIATCALIAAILLPAPVTAQSLSEMQKAMNLGQLLGSEEYCGLAFDHSAISAWIDANMDPSAMDFTQHMTLGLETEKFTQDERSASAKTAHCAATARTARHFGFIGD